MKQKNNYNKMQLNSISFTSTEIKLYNFDVLIKKKIKK